MAFLAIIAMIGLAIVHLFAGKLRFLQGTPRSIWLSTAGGISVAYVFLHLLPELAKGQEVVQESATGLIRDFERHTYLVALVGLAVFYGLERAAKRSRKERVGQQAEDVASTEVFWLHIVAFSLYNMLVGYLLIHDMESRRSLIFFFFAMALHFLVNDFGLREHFKSLYSRIGRWLLAGAVLLGAGIGAAVEIPELAISVLIAFLAGGVVLNVLKEELPEDRESRFLPFLVGAGSYAALLMLL